MSTSYHPQSDGASKRTNKTLNQSLRYFVDRKQHGWAKALPQVRFNIMNTVNASTGFSNFHLHLGRSPRLLPPITDTNQQKTNTFADDLQSALNVINHLNDNVAEAHDALTSSKINQAASANSRRASDLAYAINDQVYLSTRHRRRDYIQKGDKHVAKFMPHYDGPYTIISANPHTSTYTLDLPSHCNIHPTFHASELHAFIPNDPALFPSRELPRPGPVVTTKGAEEWEIEEIIDRRARGRGWQYLVRWKGYGPESDLWLPRREVEDCEALIHFLDTVDQVSR